MMICCGCALVLLLISILALSVIYTHPLLLSSLLSSMISNSGSTSSRPRPPPPPPPSLHFEYVHYGVESLQDTLSDLLPAHLHLPLSLLLIIVLIGSLCTIAACRACYFIERNNTLMKRSTSRLDIDAMNENEGDEAFETMESGGTGNGNNVKAPLLSASSRR